MLRSARSTQVSRTLTPSWWRWEPIPSGTGQNQQNNLLLNQTGCKVSCFWKLLVEGQRWTAWCCSVYQIRCPSVRGEIARCSHVEWAMSERSLQKKGTKDGWRGIWVSDDELQVVRTTHKHWHISTTMHTNQNPLFHVFKTCFQP